MRPARPEDFAAIHAVEAAAFEREDEALIVEAVRADGAALVELVVEEAGRIVGHILFSRMTTEPTARVAGLGPVAVAPDQQGRALGAHVLDDQRLVLAPERGGLHRVDGRKILRLGRPYQTPIFSASWCESGLCAASWSFSARNRTASSAAMQPMPAAVTAWR